MTEELKARLEKEEQFLAKSGGNMAMFSENGPVSIHLVKAVINELERQQGEIDSLKKQLSDMRKAKG